MTEGHRLYCWWWWSLPAGLRRCCCRVNVKLFLRVTLIRKPQSTSDFDNFHPRASPCSRVKSRDDPISDRRGDSAVSNSFIYIGNDDHGPLYSSLGASDAAAAASYDICSANKIPRFNLLSASAMHALFIV